MDLGYTARGPTIIYLDSKSAIDMANDPVAFKKTKHILRAAQYLRDLVARLVVTPKHVDGTRNVADILTKGQARAVFTALLKLLDDVASLEP